MNHEPINLLPVPSADEMEASVLESQLHAPLNVVNGVVVATPDKRAIAAREAQRQASVPQRRKANRPSKKVLQKTLKSYRQKHA